ncbi:MAG TPA: acetyl-CoA C-acyltransferase, partial [Spirochaeta sp.]|nr:acetyl-CoA C-acyltransferase [Spirochaeta sp.]
TDEHPRLGATLESMAKLRPAFKKEGGTVTAGNASGINDGAAILLLAGAEAVKKYKLDVMGVITGWGQGAVDPAYMGLGPVPAIRNMFKRFGGSLKDAGLIELNEAFASQSLGVIGDLCEEYGMTKDEILDRTNVNGGAIALGHPIGASGARIMVTLLYEMKKRNVQTGVASLCIGGGMGTAVRVELA